MKTITRDELDRLRDTYRPGYRVRLTRMDDPYRPDLKPGTLGTVIGVDDMGTIHVQWECGSSLGVLYSIDRCEVIGREGSQ